MKIEPYIHNFISPFSGRVGALTNYILVGDSTNVATQSPLLTHLRLDILNLKKQTAVLNILEYGAINLGNSSNNPTPTKLGVATFPLPDISSLIPSAAILNNIPIPNPLFNQSTASDWLMTGPWLPAIFAGTSTAGISIEEQLLNLAIPSQAATVVSSSLAMTQIRAAKTVKLFDNAKFFVGSKVINFDWDNPIYWPANANPITQAVLKLYGLDNSYTFTKAQSLGDLESGLLKNTVDNDEHGEPTGTLSKAIAGADFVDAVINPVGNLVVIDPRFPEDQNAKLISPSGFKIRRGLPNEFGEVIHIIEEVLIGEAARLAQLALDEVADLFNQNGAVDNEYQPIDGYDSEDLEKYTLISADKKTGKLYPLVINTPNSTDPNNLIPPIAITAKRLVDAINYITTTAPEGIADVLSKVQNALTLISTLQTAYNAYTAANNINITAIKAKDVAQDTGIGAVEAQIAALTEALETLTGVTIGSTIINFVLNIGNTINLIATKKDVSDLAEDTVRLKNDYRASHNIYFDNNTVGNRGLLACGIGVFATDTSLTDGILSNNIHPVYLKIGGLKKGLLATDGYDGFAFRAKVRNDGTSDRWRGKSLTLCAHKIEVGAEQVITDVDLLDYSKDTSEFTFLKPVTIPKVKVSSELNIPVCEAGSVDTNNFANGAMWIEY